MGVTKTDFVRGMQCPKMLWLDHHKPDQREIPADVQSKLDQGNAFGDSLMGMFGQYTEVQEYYPGTKWPDKKRMVAKTKQLLAGGTKIICEAAFMDSEGNYCAVDILRWDCENNCYDMYEIKNATEITDRFIMDVAFQADLIRRAGLNLGRVFIVYHNEEPYDIEEVTKSIEKYSFWIDGNINRLNQIKYQADEYYCEMGVHCACPYECWYFRYCQSIKKKGN